MNAPKDRLGSRLGLDGFCSMSELPPKAEVDPPSCRCRKSAKTGLEQVQQITGADAQLFNHLVGAQQERLGDC